MRGKHTNTIKNSKNNHKIQANTYMICTFAVAYGA